MMKIYTSYFTQIRHFKPNQLPLSTAVWNPKWYRESAWIDKRGVICGTSLPELSPASISQCCPCSNKTAPTCEFLERYTNYLYTLDFDAIMEKIKQMASIVEEMTGEEAEIMLMVYEVPSNPCSERVPLQNWFKSYGIEVEEWKSEK